MHFAQGGPRRPRRTGTAHVRRGFHDDYAAHKGAIAKEALDRIGALFDIERMIAGKPPDVRRDVRQRTARPKIDDLAIWLDAQLQEIPGKSDLAGAIRYARSRWKRRYHFDCRRPQDPMGCCGQDTAGFIVAFANLSARLDQRT